MGLSKAMAFARSLPRASMSLFGFALPPPLFTDGAASLSIDGSYFQQTFRDFVQSSIACVGGLPTHAS
jgi:hypothetical protein